MKTKDLSIIALEIALITVVTVVIAVPTPFGFINLSDTLILLFAANSKNKFQAFLVGAIGCLLADIFLGFGQYAVFTFIVKGIEGLIVYLLKDKKQILSFGLGVSWMVLGYGLSDVILTHNLEFFIPSAMYNSIQAGASFLLAIAFSVFSKKAFIKMNSNTQ